MPPQRSFSASLRAIRTLRAGLPIAVAACAATWGNLAVAADPPAATPQKADAPAAPARASVPIPKTPIGFSKLIVRLDKHDEIGIASADFRVRLIERMRDAGFAAVGAENLVFAKDESRRAAYLIGGTVRELECRQSVLTLSCRIGVEWQVLDVARDQVVYTILSRAVVLDTPSAEKEHLAGLLVDRALDSLLARGAFRRSLVDEDVARPSSHAPEATLSRCAPGRRLADGAEDLLKQVVIVKGTDGFGSGFFVSPEGLVLTAAHVVGDAASVKLRLRDGSEVDAVPVRMARREDVALLRTSLPLTGHTCAALRMDAPASGSEVYAAGAPASLSLAFSLTRGIVSGAPVIDGQRRLQTDASVNPGNSGGPLVDANGLVVGVVSSKIVGEKVEGVAFAIPTDVALAAVGLKVGNATDPGLLTATAPHDGADKPPAARDEADPVPSLDPEGDRLAAARAEEKRQDQERERLAREQREEEEAVERDRDRRTPGFVPYLRWVGFVVAVAGGVAVPITFFNYKEATTTRPQFDSLRTWNTVGWAALGVGATAFGVSFAFRPPARTSAVTGGPVTASVGVFPGGLALKGAF